MGSEVAVVRRTLAVVVMAGLGLAAGPTAPAPAAVGTEVPLAQVTAWGSQGSGNGQFNVAIDVAVDQSSGNVYVVESVNARVQRFTPDGGFIGSFSKLGSAPRSPSLEVPESIAIGGGNVYVQDLQLGQIARFSLTGTFLNRWSVPPQDAGPSGIFHYSDLAADSAGNVYVLTGSRTVRKYSPAGAQLLQFDGGISYNMGLGMASNGDIWLTGIDGGVERHTATGAFVSGFDASNSLATASLAVDPAGNVWVVELVTKKVLSFEPNGSLHATAGPPLFNGPSAVAASPTPDTVYVADGSRIVKVGKAARLILTFDADANGDVDRTFTVTGPGATETFTVDDDTDPTLSNTAVASGLALGTWHVDLPNTNVQVKTITCSNGVQTTDYAAHAVDVTLGVGETVTCSFYAEWIG